jgi:hypothetical protein
MNNPVLYIAHSPLYGLAWLGLAWLGLTVGSKTDLRNVGTAFVVKEIQYMKPQEDSIFIASFSP